MTMSPQCAPLTSWTGARAHALQRSLRMSNLAFAVHLGVSVRSVAGWHQKPGRNLAQGTQDILNDALERAPQQARAQFTALVSEVSSDDEGGADRPGQEPASRSAGNDAGCLAEGPGWLPDLDRSVSLLDGLAVADLADGPVAE